MHCTDFLGCQQCATGTRTYDPECGLYYCDDGCGDSPDTTEGGGETVLPGTPSPTRSPTEESDEAPDTTSSGSSDVDTTPGTTFPCLRAGGYFEITSVSNSDYDWAIGKYKLNLGTEDFRFDRVGGEGLIYIDDFAISEDGDQAILVNENTEQYVVYDVPIHQWSVWGEYDGQTPEGTNTWTSITDEEQVDITILLYDCDDNLVTLPDTCEHDCIIVSGFNSDFLLSREFETSDFEGEYCWDDEYGAYYKQLDDDYILLGLFEFETTLGGSESDTRITLPSLRRRLPTTIGESLDLYSVAFIYSNFLFEYDVTFNYPWDPYFYGYDFACDAIDQFFSDVGEIGTWEVDPDGSTFEANDGETDITATVDELTFVNCDGADFDCGGEVSSAQTISIQLFTIVGCTLIALLAW